METLWFDAGHTHPIHEFESQGAFAVTLAEGAGRARVSVVRIEPGGVIGSHPAGVDQVFAVVEGSGWIAIEGERHELVEGRAGVIPRGSMHSKGSETGLTAVMVQADRLRTRPEEHPKRPPQETPIQVQTRAATRADAAAIAEIYTEGIEDGLATFETEPRTSADVEAWFEGPGPIVVAERDGRVVAWAAATPYRPDRAVYSSVAEFSVYVAREARGHGVGRATLDALVQASETAGLWKLVSRIFPENEASLALCRSAGFREVGLYRRHAKLRGEWRDCVIVERLLGEAAEP